MCYLCRVYVYFWMIFFRVCIKKLYITKKNSIEIFVFNFFLQCLYLCKMQRAFFLYDSHKYKFFFIFSSINFINIVHIHSHRSRVTIFFFSEYYFFGFFIRVERKKLGEFLWWWWWWRFWYLYRSVVCLSVLLQEFFFQCVELNFVIFFSSCVDEVFVWMDGKRYKKKGVGKSK